MIEDTNILEEVRILKGKGMTAMKIAHHLSRQHKDYFKGSERKRSVNFSTWDVLQALAHLRESGDLPQRQSGKLKAGYRKSLKLVPCHFGNHFQNLPLEEAKG